MLFLRESNAIEDVWDELSLTYARAAWDYLIKKKKLTIRTILKTHAILMHDKLDPDETGAFRKSSVYIGGHEAKPWFVIPELMAQWLVTANGAQIVGETSPSTVEDFIVNCHLSFEAIHPFIDGNGRMGRILLNWQRVKCGLPILVYYEKEKFQKYYPLFNVDKDSTIWDNI